MPQIIGQRLPGFDRQRQHILPRRFGSPQRHRTGALIDVADHQSGDFAGPQPQAQTAPNDRVTALR